METKMWAEWALAVKTPLAVVAEKGFSFLSPEIRPTRAPANPTNLKDSNTHKS